MQTAFKGRSSNKRGARVQLMQFAGSQWAVYKFSYLRWSCGKMKFATETYYIERIRGRRGVFGWEYAF